MTGTLTSWRDAALNFLYPPVCQICTEARATATEGYVCAGCWGGKGGVRFVVAPFCERCGLPFEGEITGSFQCANCHEVKLHFRSARSAVVVSPLVLDVIHRYKYQQHLWLEPFLTDLLVRQAVPALKTESWDAIVPVPLHPVKEREREFNQAERLGAALAQATGIPLNTRLLQRVEPTLTQTRLKREERAANVRRAFAFRPSEKLDGGKFVLVDDVLTTGATTNACAAVLRAAGADEVCVWTVARGV